jgi:hypothetical protein
VAASCVCSPVRRLASASSSGLRLPMGTDCSESVVFGCCFSFWRRLARPYWKTASPWSSVALHWLVVVGWKALLSGPSPWLPVGA